MTPPQDDGDQSSPYVVRVTMRDIYETVKATEAMVAQLANNMRHAEDWRSEADRDIRSLFERSSAFVTRRELFTVVGLAASIVGAAAPFLTQLYLK